MGRYATEFVKKLRIVDEGLNRVLDIGTQYEREIIIATALGMYSTCLGNRLSSPEELLLLRGIKEAYIKGGITAIDI